MADVFDPYYEWLGITPSDQPPHHYRLLGIGLFEENAGVIANAADRQMGHLRGFAAGKHSQLSQRLLNEVASARVCLLNPDKKATYDAQLRQELAAAVVPVPRAVAVAPTPVAPFSASEPVHATDTEADWHRTTERVVLSGPILAVSGAVGIVLLGALVWWLSGSRGAQQVETEPRQLAAGEQAARELQHEPQHELQQTERPGDEVQAEPHQPEDAPGDVLVSPAADDPSGMPEHEPNQQDEPPTEPADTMPDDSAPEQPADPHPIMEDPAPAEPLELPEGPAPPSGIVETPAETAPPQPVQAAKQPVPDRAAQDGVRQILDGTYDTTAARPLPERLALVEKLAELADKSADATERFVLLRRASELASEAGEGERMMQLVGLIADEFDVDRIRVESAMLDGFSKRATNEEQIGALVRSSATVIEAALAAERFDLADSLSAAVYRACQASAGRPFRVEALNRRRRVQQLRTQADEVQAARTALQSNPDDEAAHTTLARWHGLVRDDWDEALPHFAKGSDPQLRALAGRELTSTALDAAAQVELADAWWDLAATSDQQAKPVFLRRAAHWYEQAYPELTSTLVKARVAKRLDELEKAGQTASSRPEAGPPPPAVAPFDAQRAAQHQQAWAKHLNVSVEETNPIGMKLRLIPPGEFLMGTTEESIQAETQMSLMQADRSFRDRLETESPQHRVRITRPFWMGVTEVTQDQYFRVMGVNPSRSQVPNLPVARVTWLEAAEFCRRLTEASGKKLGDRVYRLPTEAEWEYACRAGSTMRYHFGDEDGSLAEYGWFRFNSNRRAQPVATRRPNPWGLFDMHGNVAEWVVDWHSRSYYSESPVDDPTGPSRGWTRVVRGGDFYSIPAACRSASRGVEYSESRSWNVGFRVVLVSADAADPTQAPDAETASPEPTTTLDR